VNVRLLSLWLGLCALVLTLGLLASGCSSGSSVALGPSTGGGGGRTAGAPMLLAGNLPVPQRKQQGYTFTEVQVGAVLGGSVSALGIAPTASDTLLAHTPLNQAAVFGQGGLGAAEVTFQAPVADFALLGQDVYAATAQPGVTGVGDVFRRSLVGGVPSWTVALDTNDERASVAFLSSANQLAAATGRVGGDGTLWQIDAASLALVSSTSLGAQVPTAAVVFPAASDDVLVGTTANTAGGGAASLLRVRGGALETLGLPTLGAQPGVREQVTALVPAGQSGVLIVAVASYDDATGAALGGEVLITTGFAFESLHTFSAGEAPTALAFVDDTVYVGTSAGQVLYRDDTGVFQVEPGLPALTRVESLLARDPNTLLIGGENAAGAVLVVRSGN
jgi:hypothetical protein